MSTDQVFAPPLDQEELDAGWESLRMPNLGRLDQDEQRRIRAVSDQVAGLVEPWLGGVSDQYRGLSWTVAVTLAAITPELSAAELVPVVKLSCWTLVFDDVFDNHHLSIAEHHTRMRRYLDFLAGAEVDAADPVARALADCRDELRSVPLFAELEPEWRSALEATMRAMMVECEWRHAHDADPQALPSFEDYLANAVEAIDSRPVTWAALTVIGDRSVLEQMDFLHGLSATLARCIRLANDLRTHVKEAGEGTINSVLVLSSADVPGQPADPRRRLGRALREIAADIDVHLRELKGQAEKPRTSTGRAERWIADCADFVSEFYSRHEYRTLFDTES
ncbi:Terpene synthase family, metal binding domain [Lentzea fradiae]|uniref:Terpene synthase family, metal binding domain n=1 Tax=Lentzea fradiae TaxID=200378 RepID=A0A1G7UVU4_9PSEU|nr:terpene synthase family protein [Lentzea fradiae]SDG51259.1 Terpene synthase family, metal binding domain [Lentzea fradiae]